MSKFRKFVAVAGAASLFALAGCGGDDEAKSVDPKTDLRNAAKSFEDAQAMSLKMSISGDAESFAGLDGSEASDEDMKLAEQISNSSLTIMFDKGEDAESAEDDLSKLAVEIDSLDAGEVIMANAMVYMMVDMDGIADKFEGARETIDQLRDGVNGVPELSSLVPLVNGEWVQIDPMTVEQLTGSMGMGADMTASPDAMVEELKTALGTIVSDATITRDKDDAEEIIVTTNLRDAYTALEPVLSGAAGSAAGLTGTDIPSVEDVPDTDMSFSIWVKDDKFQKMELDLAQFSETSTGPVLMTVEFDDAVSIEVPEDAQVADLSMLFGSMMS